MEILNMAAVAESTESEMEPFPEDSYVLEQVTIPDYSDEDFTYEEVPIEDNYSVSEGSEDLETAVRTLKEETVDKNILQKQSALQKASVTLRPEVIDDFVRNFLVKMRMTRTLDCFQNEWYELQERGLLNKEEVKVVPDIYVRNEHLDDMIKSLHEEVTRFKDAADRARQTYVRLRKERDFHRMHHKRVVQEKNKLVTDLRRLKKHYASYEPTLKTLKQKYEVAMKEKMLTKLERDRAVGQIIGLHSTLQNMGENTSFEETDGDKEDSVVSKEFGERVMEKHDLLSTTKVKQHPKDSSFPPDMGMNPLLAHQKGPSPHLSRAGGFRLTNTINAHNLAISGISLHPRKQVLASCSDDHTWKIWSVPSGELIMTGEGHKDWVADCDFHPSGGRLATASGDSTVKIWDFTKAECVLTFTDHIHAVWGCSWHSCGEFLATCSMDCSGKIWDLNSERCRLTLRGHADSVNSISFLPYSNTLLSCSADKTLSLWDARTGLCGQTFFGHMHSINHCVINLRGDTIASCDSYGVVKLWDVRTVGSLASIELGPHPANRVTFDASGSVVAIASNDGSVRMYEVASTKQSQLTGHEEAVQTVLFDKAGEFLISAGSDGTVRIWS